MKFTVIKSCLARFGGIFALGTPSNIHGTAISYCCAKFGAFVNSVTILTLRDLTKVHVSTEKQAPWHKSYHYNYRSLSKLYKAKTYKKESGLINEKKKQVSPSFKKQHSLS